jgi:hypothetical protein
VRLSLLCLLRSLGRSASACSVFWSCFASFLYLSALRVNNSHESQHEKSTQDQVANSIQYLSYHMLHPITSQALCHCAVWRVVLVVSIFYCGQYGSINSQQHLKKPPPWKTHHQG